MKTLSLIGSCIGLAWVVFCLITGAPIHPLVAAWGWAIVVVIDLRKLAGV